MEYRKKVILDCDPGHDDAFAIMLAAANLDVLGITTIGGNCTLENVTANALKVLEVIGRQDIPVYPGHSRPLVAPLVTAPQFHGASGLDLRGGRVLPEPKTKPQSKHAVDFICETVMNTDDVTIIATGPLTNIASALNRKPEIANRIKEISIMGGSVTFGNWTPMAEFNIFVDPEAASRVFNSGIHIKMSGLNLTRQCCIQEKEVKQFRSIGNKAGDLAADLTEFFIDATAANAKLKGAHMHDGCAAAWVIDESIVKGADMHIDVELNGTLTRGMTVCDYRHMRGPIPEVDIYRDPQMSYRGKQPNSEAGLELDFDKFMQLVYNSLKKFN